MSDLVFLIHSGYSLKPRNIYIYDIAQDFMIRQQNDPVNNLLEGRLTDIDQDGNPEIIGMTYAPGNTGQQPVFLSDTCSWFF